ncbi:MAG: response regulator [Acidobacteriaceae bacterium]|nr:response regulator [Acidobacteriaceae bacterium]MBV9266123.1 response regulator [Acidobacteriaceae bacterium]
MAFTVLIVDDSPAMRSFVKRVLELSGFDMGVCHEAGNGQEALDLLSKEWVDVVLTDINMPVMNGQEFVQNLAADESLHAIPVIVVSTDRTEDRVRQMIALGAKGYVKKPFQPEELREELEKVLGVAYAGN